VVILVDELELLVLTLPEEMNVQLDGTRAHKMASVSVDHQLSDNAGCYPVLFSSKGIKSLWNG